MTVQDLYRVLLNEQEVEIYSHKVDIIVWTGKARDIPICFFNNLVSSLYSQNDSNDSYIRINLSVVQGQV